MMYAGSMKSLVNEVGITKVILFAFGVRYYRLLALPVCKNHYMQNIDAAVIKLGHFCQEW